VREEAGVLQETLDNIVSELEKDVESLTHLRPNYLLSMTEFLENVVRK